MPVRNHVHKLRSYTMKNESKGYFCVDPVCTYRVPCKLTLGKLTICWICGREFELTPYSYQLAKPHCPNCHKPKVDSKHETKARSAESVVNDLSRRLRMVTSSSDEGDSTDTSGDIIPEDDSL